MNRAKDADRERREEGISTSAPTDIASATIIRNSDNTSSNTHTSPSQPFHDPTTTNHHTTHPLDDHENSQPMLEPDAEMRVIHAWMSAIRQITSLRDIILTARMDIKRERMLCYQQEEFFQGLMDDFVVLLNSAIEDDSYIERKNEFDNLSGNMKSSGKELKVLRQRTSGMEDGLSSQEYRLTQLENELHQYIDAEYRLNSTQPIENSSRTSMATTLHAKTNDTEPPTNPRDELYSRMGDLRILLDRLNDFEYELRQELDERDVLRATGQIKVSDDTVFFEEVRNEREKLQRELEDAQSDVERLKQVCARKGIEFEDVYFHSPFYPNNEYDQASSTPSIQAEVAKPLLHESPSGIVSNYFSMRERVKDWLEDPSSVVPSLPATAEKEPENNARRWSQSSGDWVLTHSWPQGRRPSSTRSAGNIEAHFGMPPQWNLGPLPGSDRITAMLKDSMTEPVVGKSDDSL